MDVTVGIDVGGSGMRGVAVTRDGKSVGEDRCAPMPRGGPNAVRDAIAALVTDVRAAHAHADVAVRAVGVGIPAFLQRPGGVVAVSPNLPELNGWRAQADITTALDCPTVVENDADAAAYGEARCGGHDGQGPFIYLGLGTGVGGGVVLDGAPLTGARGMASELGHLTVYPDGARCPCGAAGCVEAYASAVGLVARFFEATSARSDTDFVVHYGVRKDITPKVIATFAERGDAAAIASYQQAGEALGIALSQLIHVFDPATLCIGGGMSAAWPLFAPAMLEQITARTPAAMREGLAIVPASLGDRSGRMGAGMLAWRALK